MGLRMAITTKDSSEYAEAYFKISSFRDYDLKRKKCDFSLDVFKDKAARDTNKARLHGLTVRSSFQVVGSDFDIWFSDTVLKVSGNSLWKQAYLYVKSLNEYSSALDVDPD